VSTRAIRVGVGAVALTLVPAAAAQAKTITVTSLGDTGTGTLRAAITEADADLTKASGPDLILFASKLSGSIDLKSDLPQVTDSIDLHGPGALRITINGKKVPAGSGPLLYDKTSGTDLTVVGLSFVDSTQESGSFIFTQGSIPDPTNLKLVGDSFAHGDAEYGGAVYTGYTALTVDDCTFAHNLASTFGGAIQTHISTIKIEDSTIADNTAYEGGGGLSSFDPDATIIGTTITGNSVSYSGHEDLGYGGGIDFLGGTLSLKDSIVAGNTATGNPKIAFPEYGSRHRDIFIYGGTAMTASFSLIQNDTNSLPGFKANSTDITGKSPDLGPLRNNGGGVDTELPSAKSPVVNAGKAYGLKTDQRGLKRTVKYPGVKLRKGSDGTDIGAAELQPPKKTKRHH
jgi:predicted outer membrane repeat protein